MRRGFTDEEQYQQIVNYLLGELAREEAEEFEQHYLADQDTFELLEAIEEDLIEDYLTGVLPTGTRLLFEQRYLNRPENREKIDFARRYLQCTSLERVQPEVSVEAAAESGKGASSEIGELGARSGKIGADARLAKSKLGSGAPFVSSHGVQYRTFAVAASIAFAILLAITVWLWYSVRRLNQRLASTEQARTQLEERERELQRNLDRAQGDSKVLEEQLQQVRDQLKALQAPGGGGDLASSVFPLFLRRSVRGPGQGPSVRLKPGTATLELKLDVSGSDFDSYEATVRSSSGSVVSSPRNLKPVRTSSSGAQGRTLVMVKLPASGLKPGEYTVRVNGVPPTGAPIFAGDYSFTLLPE
ncbi:MAG TPA: hypothetical protein VEZ90_03095 [Blastocatellia bacterium]|nr:hypothetical protein [Blastocatellia bacterium]